MQLESKTCVECGENYLPSGKAQLYCADCGLKIKRIKRNKWFNNQRRIKGKKIGSGSIKGEQASFYKHGKSVFDRYARERKEQLQHCEECNKNLVDASRWGWVGHHIDHNPMNNVITNLKILCKRCHQIEHKCWENFFEGATTISKESRADNSPEAPATQNG
jgi:hypothetical protein